MAIAFLAFENARFKKPLSVVVHKPSKAKLQRPGGRIHEPVLDVILVAAGGAPSQPERVGPHEPARTHTQPTRRINTYIYWPLLIWND